MAKTALITGASTGIGYALTRCFAADRHNLVLVARRAHRLQTIADDLRKEYGITVKTIATDLARSEAPREIADEVRQDALQIDYLVNNAGFGLGGRFAETELRVELGMIQVNVAAVVHLTKLFLPEMLARKTGGVLNVSSTAAFQPGPLMSVYYATKAFVLSFTEAIANELVGTGVTVTALCPGPTQSEFQQRARIENTRLVKGKFMGFMTAEEVAKIGYRGFMQGKRLVIPGLMNKLGAHSVRFAPRRLATQVARMLQES